MPFYNKQELTRAIISGSHEAFNMYFRLEYNNLVFFIESYIRERQPAKDIAQEAFIALWNYRSNIIPESNIRTLLFSIARNKTMNYLRDKKGTVALNAVLELCHPAVDVEMEKLELETLINKLYATLPPKVKDSFILSRRHGLSYQEIADKKGVSVKVVEYHIVLALKFFRKKLGSYVKIGISIFLGI